MNESDFEESTETEITAELLTADPVTLEPSESPLDVTQVVPVLEALLFASGEPLSLAKVVEITFLDPVEVEAAFTEIEARYEREDSGIQLQRVADKFQLRTRGQYARYIQTLFASRPKRLSPPALETLSIVAYRQPIVKSDIERIRGVDVTPTLKTLLERNLVKMIGHQPTVGQPALYGTTEEFLKLFGLNTLSELPTLRELREIDRDPGEMGASEESDSIDDHEKDVETPPGETVPISEHNEETSPAANS